MKKFKYKDDINYWLKFARYDLKCARLEFKGKLYTAVCYSCQQIAEKSLKAVLLSFEIKIIKSHDLPEILERLIQKNKIFSSLSKDCQFLNGFYISTRYPGNLGGPEGMYDCKDAQKAIRSAKQILQFVEKEIA